MSYDIERSKTSFNRSVIDGDDLGLLWSISVCVNTKGGTIETKCLVPASCSQGRRLRKLQLPDLPFTCDRQVKVLAVPDDEFLSSFFCL